MDQLADIKKEFPDRAYEMQASLVHNVLMFIEVQLHYMFRLFQSLFKCISSW